METILVHTMGGKRATQSTGMVIPKGGSPYGKVAKRMPHKGAAVVSTVEYMGTACVGSAIQAVVVRTVEQWANSDDCGARNKHEANRVRSSVVGAGEGTLKLLVVCRRKHMYGHGWVQRPVWQLRHICEEQLVHQRR